MNENSIPGWFHGRLPDDWTTVAPAAVTVDREEITVIITVEAPELDGADEATAAEAAAGRMSKFREETRDQRVAIAREAEHRFDRKVSWGLAVGDSTGMFTHLSVPTMTRLRQSERQVLDTLIAAGVARSRSDALAWCVRLVGEHADEWLTRLRSAIDDVERIRADGPV